MPTPVAYPHTYAALTVLRDAGLTVYVAGPTDTAAPPYVVLWPGPGLLGHRAIGSPAGRLDLAFQVSSVGVGPEQALDFADRARTALVGARPVVVGRTTWRVVQDEEGPGVQRDNDTTPPLYTVPIGYTFRSY